MLNKTDCELVFFFFFSQARTFSLMQTLEIRTSKNRALRAPRVMGSYVFFKWHRRALLTISAAPHLMCKFYVNQMPKEDLTRATRTSVLLCLGCSQVCLNGDLDSPNWNHRWDDKLLPPLCWVWFVLSRSTKCSWKQGAKVSPTNFRRLTARYNNLVSWLKLGRGLIRFYWLQCHYQICQYFIDWFDFLWGKRVDQYRFST